MMRHTQVLLAAVMLVFAAGCATTHKTAYSPDFQELVTSGKVKCVELREAHGPQALAAAEVEEEDGKTSTHMVMLPLNAAMELLKEHDVSVIIPPAIHEMYRDRSTTQKHPTTN
jgi:hypothetical protein